MYAWVQCVLLVCAIATVSGHALGPTDVVFHLFSRENPQQSEPLLPNLGSLLTALNFGISRRTIIAIHSHGDDAQGNFVTNLLKAHLDVENVNFIAVDWSKGSSLYSFGLSNAPQAGEIIANFVNILITNFGYNSNLVRIVGVGLGGHIAGIASKKIRGEVPHIIALDPSLVGWTHHPDRLKPDDARVVEVLHTTAGVLGYDHPLGDIDFYPNGGRFQNGCGTDISCSHGYSVAFYTESLDAEANNRNRFVGTACNNYSDAINQQCSGNRDVSFGGTSTKSGQSGIYSFVTNSAPPFARN